MKKLCTVLAAFGFAIAASVGAFAGTFGDRTSSTGVLFAQEDCKDGEKWNEETQKCEADDAGN